jgi:DNA invertase Pin-like site-specific DNA recombinase
MAATPKKRISALAYLRTSSATNVDGDSSERQRAAIRAYAERAGIEVVGEFYDAAVSGADPLESRPGFVAMLDRIEGNGVRLVLVEDASRFARALMVQELGLLAMQRRGVRVVTASGEDLTAADDPARVAMRQVAGAFAEFEKARLVHKLRGARDRASTAAGRRVEGAGRPPWSATPSPWPAGCAGGTPGPGRGGVCATSPRSWPLPGISTR